MQTDEQLISAYQDGDPEAFEQLYQRHKNGLYRYFYRQLKQPSIADELHQEVWMSIIKTSVRFNQQSLFTTWLYKIAHNRLVDYYRSQQQQFEAQCETQEENEASQVGLNSASEPESQLAESQIAQMVLTAVSELPAEQRETFLLYEQSGLSLKEIAHITQVSFESSKSRLRYAIKKLRLQLGNLL